MSIKIEISKEVIELVKTIQVVDISGKVAHNEVNILEKMQAGLIYEYPTKGYYATEYAKAILKQVKSPIVTEHDKKDLPCWCWDCTLKKNGYK